METSVAGNHVLIEADLGYGSGKPYGVPKPGGYAVAVLQVRGPNLARVATYPYTSGDFSVVGW